MLVSNSLFKFLNLILQTSTLSLCNLLEVLFSFDFFIFSVNKTLSVNELHLDGLEMLLKNLQSLLMLFDFQTKLGYPKTPEGRANLGISTNQVANRFGACAMTLEMPYKDLADFPEPEQGRSPERCKLLARDCLASLLEWLETREG